MWESKNLKALELGPGIARVITNVFSDFFQVLLKKLGPFGLSLELCIHLFEYRYTYAFAFQTGGISV